MRRDDLWHSANDLCLTGTDTFSVIFSLTPIEVRLTGVDDDGRIVNVGSESSDYRSMLAFIGLLEDVPQFEYVQMLRLERENDDGK